MNTVEQLGTFHRFGDHLNVTFERLLPRPPETVWQALTDPARLADWMGMCAIEPQVGGLVHLMIGTANPAKGHVMVWDPPRVLEFSWSNATAPQSVVRFELTPAHNGTRMIFMHKGMPFASSALMLPGWHLLLARLAAGAIGAPDPTRIPDWRELQEAYVAQYELHGLPLNECAAAHQPEQSSHI